MTPKEHMDQIELRTQEVLLVITSIQELMLLAEHYQNPPETKDFLTLISVCTNRLETIIQKMKNAS